jgi:hypothetical protein
MDHLLVFLLIAPAYTCRACVLKLHLFKIRAYFHHVKKRRYSLILDSWCYHPTHYHVHVPSPRTRNSPEQSL